MQCDRQVGLSSVTCTQGMSLVTQPQLKTLRRKQPIFRQDAFAPQQGAYSPSASRSPEIQVFGSSCRRRRVSSSLAQALLLNTNSEMNVKENR